MADHGLTEYQARVYLTLLDLGSATASQISPLSKVPRTRIYAAMQQLHEKGLVQILPETPLVELLHRGDRKSTRLNSSHRCISYAVFCLKKKKDSGCNRENSNSGATSSTVSC